MLFHSHSACFRSAVKRYISRSFSSVQYGPKPGHKVVVGMSGGVDSSVAAKLLADQDFDLSAIFMRNWDTRDESATDKGCEWEKDWEDVQRVCKVLDIPCEMIDLSREYWTRVFEPSLRSWESGVTPNPDVWCNKEIKFGALLEHLPVDNTSNPSWFATGHYARKSWAIDPNGGNPRPQLLTAADPNKDQSFYLSSISEAGLRRALFPLGHLTKPQVRELAKQHQLPTAERPESMGLCFVGEKRKFREFLNSYIPPKPGPIVDLMTRKVVGKHPGLWTYTIGENARVGGMREKKFVADKETKTNTVYIVSGSNHPALLLPSMYVEDFHWIWKDAPPLSVYDGVGFRAMVKFRHRMESVGCTVHAHVGRAEVLEIIFDEPQRAVAPGQVATLWSGDWCLGCGTIRDADRSDVLDGVD